MGSVIPLKKEVDNSYLELVNLVGNKLNDVNQQIKYKLASEVNLIHKMTSYHLKSGGKKIRPLLTLSSAKLCGYENGNRDVNLAAVFEFMILKYFSSNISISPLYSNCETSPWAIFEEVEDNNFNISRDPSSTIISKQRLSR